MLYAYIHKERVYESEKELRALICKNARNKKGKWFAEETIGDGLSVKVDLNILIEAIYVCPKADDWFIGLLKAVIKRYGYLFPVSQSSMDMLPHY